MRSNRFPTMWPAPVALVLALAGCTPSPPASAPSGPASDVEASAAPETPAPESPAPVAVAECPPTPLKVTIDYALEQDAAGGVKVMATTNLPDGAVLGASFFADELAFFAQDDGQVVDGAVEFGPFSDKGTPLHGTYDFSITLPIARNQPASVQDCLGKAGELMTGPLVHEEEITGDLVASLDEAVTID